MSGVRPIKWNIQNALCEQAPNSILYIRFCMAELLRINHKKRGLKELMKRISQNKVDKVVVLYKDRLLRFGFELVEYIASLYNCDIEIIDNTEKSEQQELVEDFVQILTVFSCKLQGKRANKARNLVKGLIEEGEQ